MNWADEYRHIIRSEFNDRVLSNSRYSLRAFSRDCEIPVSRMSEVLNAKRGFPLHLLKNFVEKAGFPEKKAALFTALVRSQHERSRECRIKASRDVVKIKSCNYQSLKKEGFAAIRDWYHFAILELLKIYPENLDSQIAARELGISSTQAKMAITNLKQARLIKQESNTLVLTNENLKVESKEYSADIREFHRQFLSKTSSEVLNGKIEDRYISSSFVAMDQEGFDRISKIIERVKNRIVHAEKVGSSDFLCGIGFQFFKIYGGNK